MSFAIIGVSLAALSVLGTVASGTIGYLGARESANAASKSAQYNAQVQSNNAGAANQQAKFDASQITRANERNTAQQRAAMSASGFDPNTGTFSDVTSDTKKQGELDKLSRLYQGTLGMTSSTSGAQLYTVQGQSARSEAAYGETASVLGSLSTATTIGSGQIENNPLFQN